MPALTGLCLAALVAGLAGFVAARAGAALVPSGADLLERLVVSGMVGVIGWVALTQVLGLVGVLWLPVVIASLALLAVGAWRWLPAWTAPAPAAPGGAPWRLVMVAIPFAVLAIVEVLSISPTLYLADSVRYHIVNAAQFLDSGSIRGLPFAQPADGSSGSPANAALLLLVVMLPLHTDALVGLVDLGCAVLVVGFAAVLMRRLGRSAWVGAGAGLVLVTTWSFFGTQIASAYDDGIGVLGLVAGLVFGIECVRTGRLRWLILSGMSIGLAMGTKGVDLLPALAVAVAVALMAQLWRRPARFVCFGLATVSLALAWYVRDWAVTGDPLYPETLRLGSLVLFHGLGPTTASAQADAQSVAGTLLSGHPASPGDWLVAAIANYGLGVLVPPLSVALAVRRRGAVRVLLVLSAVCTAAYLVTPFTGSASELFGATRYLLPAMAFGVCGLAATLPLSWLAPVAGIALIVNGVSIPVFQLGEGFPATTVVVGAGASLLLVAAIRLGRVVKPPTRAAWFRGGVVAISAAVAVLVTANLQPAGGQTPVGRALLAARDPAAPVVVMDVTNVTAILGRNLDVNVVAAGEGPVGAERPIEDPGQLTQRIRALHPAAIVIGNEGTFNTIPAAWRPPGSWHRIGVEAGAVVYEP